MTPSRACRTKQAALGVSALAPMPAALAALTLAFMPAVLAVLALAFMPAVLPLRHAGAVAQLSAVPAPRISWEPRVYVCQKTAGQPVIDGSIADAEWRTAPWTADFVDIEGQRRPAPNLRTRVKMLWDERFFYVAAEMEEPHLWGTLTERDAVIYHDDDFEVFIDPDGDTHEYYELELNALGTVWDLLLVRPYRDGGPAVDAWDIQGLATAVSLDGTLNDPGDVDTGWSVEMAIPWSVLDDCAHRPCPPRHGDRWRVNFSRVDWPLEVSDGQYLKRTSEDSGEPLPENNWVWSPQGLVAMHYPEMWGFVQFSERGPGRLEADRKGAAAPHATVALPPSCVEHAGWALRGIYYEERNIFAAHGSFTSNVSLLDPRPPTTRCFTWPPSLATTPRGFEAWVTTNDGTLVAIDETGRLRVEPGR